MPTKRPPEDWVEAIRTFVRDTLGNKNWQIRKGERDKVRLGIRFDDGSRSYKYLPYKWQRGNANEIRHFIEAIHYLHIKKNIDIDESLPQHEEFSVMTNLSCPRCESQVEVLKKRDAFD